MAPKRREDLSGQAVDIIETLHTAAETVLGRPKGKQRLPKSVATKLAKCKNLHRQYQAETDPRQMREKKKRSDKAYFKFKNAYWKWMKKGAREHYLDINEDPKSMWKKASKLIKNKQSAELRLNPEEEEALVQGRQF